MLRITDQAIRRIALRRMNSNKTMEDGDAEAAAYDIIATYSNPSSYAYLDGFPGMDFTEALSDKTTADALVYALQAGEGSDISRGILIAMLMYGIISVETMKQLEHEIINKNHPGDGMY